MKKTIVLLLGLLVLTGCPGKKSSSNGHNNIVGCVNCGFNPAIFTQAVTAEIPQAVLTMDIVGDANQMNVWGQNGMNPFFAYQGPVTVNGTLNVSVPLPMGMCQLPAGLYTARTIQQGIYNLGVFQVPAVELLGPVRMIVAMTDGVILTNGNGSIIGFSVLMVGQQGPSAMNSGWGYPQTGLNMTSCVDSIGVRF